jgi:hypothetical protein
MGVNFKMIWYIDENGKPAADRVVLGQTDGTNTEIVRSRKLQAGTKVIVALASDQKNQKTTTTTAPMGPMGRPPF